MFTNVTTVSKRNDQLVKTREVLDTDVVLLSDPWAQLRGDADLEVETKILSQKKPSEVKKASDFWRKRIKKKNCSKELLNFNFCVENTFFSFEPTRWRCR